MDISSLMKAVAVRRSRRKFLGKPIDVRSVAELRERLVEYNKAGNIRMELVTNNGKAFDGFTKSYGMFSGVNDYIVLIADKNDKTAVERLGYYGELMVLHATEMGLGSCWVGGAFSRSDMPVELSGNEEIVCAVIVGNTEEKYSFKEKLMRGVTHLKTKSIEQMYTSDAPVPKWFTSGMESVQKAPSAVNRQPVMFSYKNGNVSAEVRDITNAMLALDFGIAKLHFELGVGGGKWEWGNGGGFVPAANEKVE